MACNLPVITTGAGAVLDFVSEDTAFLVPAERQTCTSYPCGPRSDSQTVFDEATPFPPKWHVVSPADLAKAMLKVMSDPQEAQRRANAARQWVERHLTWKQPRRLVEDRIVALASRVEHRNVRGSVPVKTDA